MAAEALEVAAGPAPPPTPLDSRRRRLWRWWLRSRFQQTWVRLAIQAGVCTLLIMCIFSAPPVWNLLSFDPVLANPVLILVIANLGILFTANTGLPAPKIGLEGILGSLAGGVSVYAVAFLTYAIQGGSTQQGVLKGAMYLLFGAPLLMLATASRFRWPQHISLAAVFYNLSVAVGLAVDYLVPNRIWRFVLYWWWFIALATLFMIGVATVVLPIPAGWVVRKQLARALRQEGAVLDAIVQLMTAEGEGEPEGGGEGEGSGAGANPTAAAAGAAQHGGGAGPGPVSVVPLGREASLEEESPPDDDDEEEDFPAPQPTAAETFLAGAARVWRRLRRATVAGGGATLSRISSAVSFRSRGGSGAGASRAQLTAEAAALGISPDMFDAVEPIYAHSGVTSASMQSAFAHMRFTQYEWDLYRPTHRLPLLAFQRLLLLARTLLSAAVMLLYPLQSGQARLSASREHAGHMRRTAGEIRRCCQSLAAVLRSNAPVGPALEQLGRLEQAYLDLQQAVGAAAATASPCSAGQGGGLAESTARQMAEQLAAAEQAGSEQAAAAAEPVSFRPQRVEYQSAGEGLAGADVAATKDSLALHLALFMLFTCCTRVRSMYLLLPQLVGRDQEGADVAVSQHFATAHTWEAVLQARKEGASERVPGSPRSATDIFRHSQLLLGGATGSQRGGLRASRSAAALDKLGRPTVTVAEPAEPRQQGALERAAGQAGRAVSALEGWTGFSRSQMALGLQMGVAWSAMMFLVMVPAVNAALGHRAVWAVFIAVVVHEPMLGSVVWKCVLRFGGTVVAGVLGLGALYFAFLCNHLSFENHPAKFIAMTVALTVLTMPLAAGVARYGLANAYFWIVSCLLMYTVALPGYAHTSTMPVLALWRLACTALGIAIELVVAVVVFPVTARSAAHAVTAGALRGMADVAELAFSSVLHPCGTEQQQPGGKEGSARGRLSRRGSLDGGMRGSMALAHLGALEGAEVDAPAPPAALVTLASPGTPGREPQQQQQGGGGQSPGKPGGQQEEAGQGQGGPHVAVPCPAPGGWQGNGMAAGVVLSRIHKPMLEAYSRTTTLRALLVPLRVEYHPFKQPARFPIAAGRRAQRLCRRMLNVLSTFALTMDNHHSDSMPLLEAHAAELEALICQLREALRALASVVAGSVTLESAARTVAALEAHAQHLLLRVLVSGAPEGLAPADATQGLAFLALLFNVTSVARLLCIALGEAFCPADAEGQAAAASLLRDAPRWAGDDRLQALAAELLSEVLVGPEGE